MDWFNTGKHLFNKGKQWLETAGDMNAASNNPQEKVDWTDGQQKQIEQEKKALRPQIGLTGIPQNKRQSRQQVNPPALAIPDATLAPLPKTGHDDPIYDWTGHPVSEEERQRILASRAEERMNHSDDVNDVLDRMKKLREERDTPNKMAFRFDSDIQENRQAQPQQSAFEQAAEAMIPQDESLTPFFDHLNENPKDLLGENSLWWENPPGQPDWSDDPFREVVAQAANRRLGLDSKVHGNDSKRIAGQSDQSYKNATDAAAKNITDNLGENSAVSGYGRAPAGQSDLSYGPAIGDVTENFGSKSAVTGEGKYVIGAPNMSYWNWEKDESLNKPLDMTSDGAKRGWKDAQILFDSAAALAGDHLFNLIGGDDTSPRRVKAILDLHQKELKGMSRLTMDDLYREGDPERTMQNVTRYLYQELGDQTVKLPAYFIAGHLKTFAQLFGVSSAVLSSQFYRDFREKTGHGHPVESIMYGVPLGLMSAALLHFRNSGVFQSAREVKDYVQSFIVGTAVHKAQQEVRKKVVNEYGNNKNIKKLR